MPFTELISEFDTVQGERQTWFHFGEKPKDMRVRVSYKDSSPEVMVQLEWHNRPLNKKGTQLIRIPTYDDLGQGQLMQATEMGVLRTLQVFGDVLNEEGVAGPTPEELEPEEDDDEEDAAAEE